MIMSPLLHIARWAHMHQFASVCRYVWTLPTDQNNTVILHISILIRNSYFVRTWSWSRVAWIKVTGHVGQGQHEGHDIGRWDHINVKLFHLYPLPLRREELLKFDPNIRSWDLMQNIYCTTSSLAVMNYLTNLQ